MTMKRDALEKEYRELYSQVHGVIFQGSLCMYTNEQILICIEQLERHSNR